MLLSSSGMGPEIQKSLRRRRARARLRMMNRQRKPRAKAPMMAATVMPAMAPEERPWLSLFPLTAEAEPLEAEAAVASDVPEDVRIDDVSG